MAVSKKIQTTIIVMSKSGARRNKESNDDSPEATVSIVLSSEYAIVDVASPDVYSAMCSTSLNEMGINDLDCVNTIPVVRDRSRFYGLAREISVDSTGESTGSTASTVDVIDIFASVPRKINRTFSNAFLDTTAKAIRGEVVHV